jgi:uncharacterized membrane protein YidH (DUF202 family)
MAGLLAGQKTWLNKLAFCIAVALFAIFLLLSAGWTFLLMAGGILGILMSIPLLVALLIGAFLFLNAITRGRLRRMLISLVIVGLVLLIAGLLVSGI